MTSSKVARCCQHECQHGRDRQRKERNSGRQTWGGKGMFSPWHGWYRERSKRLLQLHPSSQTAGKVSLSTSAFWQVTVTAALLSDNSPPKLLCLQNAQTHVFLIGNCYGHFIKRWNLFSHIDLAPVADPDSVPCLLLHSCAVLSSVMWFMVQVPSGYEPSFVNQEFSNTHWGHLLCTGKIVPIRA